MDKRNIFTNLLAKVENHLKLDLKELDVRWEANRFSSRSKSLKLSCEYGIDWFVSLSSLFPLEVSRLVVIGIIVTLLT